MNVDRMRIIIILSAVFVYNLAFLPPVRGMSTTGRTRGKTSYSYCTYFLFYVRFVNCFNVTINNSYLFFRIDGPYDVSGRMP